MGLLLDTSALVERERGRYAIPVDEDVGIAAITASELLQGVHRADRAHRAAREAIVEGMLEEIPTIPFTLPIARVHARLWAELASRGRVPGANDLEIAATAVSLGWDVLTREARGFADIPGLRVRRID